MKHLSIVAVEEQSNLSTVACMAGAYEIFCEANAYWKRLGKGIKFKIELVSASRRRKTGNGLFTLTPQACISDVCKTNLVIIPSSLVRNYESATDDNKKLINWISQQYEQGAEIASMCTGVFMLASAGLLNEKTCSTHWAASEQFKRLFPAVDLQADKLITDEDGIYTNGGAYSFLHLIIYLIEKHFDRQTSVYCAKIFQIDVDRNLQAGFSIFNGHKQHNDEVILKAQSFIEKKYPEKISIELLSSKFNVGRRTFDRRFIKATGLTPLDYLQRVKIEAAKKLLEHSRKTVNEVMYEVGYSDAKAFREVFNRVTGITPVDYRTKYTKNRY